MSGSGEFQEVESNPRGTLSHVPSQPEVIPSSSSMLSCDKRLPLATWNAPGLQENVCGNQCSTLGSPQNSRQGIHLHKRRRERETELVPRAKGTGTSFARDDGQIKGTIPMPMFARRPSAMSSSILVKIQQNPMVGQQRQQISELHFDKFTTPQLLLCWKIRFKNQVTTCSDFPSDTVLWINEVEMVDSLDEFLNPRDWLLHRIVQTVRCWTRRLLLHWTRSSRIPTSRRRSVSRSRKPKRRVSSCEEDGSLSWSTTVFEWLALMTQNWIMLICSLLFFMTIMFRNSVQDGTKFCYLCQKFHPTMSWKVCIQWTILNHCDQKRVTLISRILRCRMRELHLLWTKSSRIPTSRKMSVWRNRKLRKRIGSCAWDRSLTLYTTTFELLVLMIPYLMTPIYFQLLWWCSRIWCEMGWNAIVDDKKSTRWCSGKFVQIEHTWVRATQNRIRIVRHGDSSEDIDAQWSKIWRRWWKGVHIRSYDYETSMPEMIEFEAVAVVTNRRGHRGVERGQGECCQWKAKGQCSRGDQCSFWHDGDERAKSTPKNAPSSEPPTQRGRDASRERNFRVRSLSTKSNRQPCRDLLKGICTKVPCDNWHPPDVNFQSLNRIVNSAKSARFRTGRLRNNRIEGPRRVVTKVQWLSWKMCDSWVAYFRTQSRWNLHRFYGRAQESWDQFDECNSQKLRSVMLTSEKRSIAW